MILSHLTTSIDSLCLQDNMQTYKKKSYAKFSTATLNIFLHISLIHCMSYSQWITHQSLFGCCVYLNSCSFVCGQHLSLYMPGFIGQSPNDSLKLSWNESPWFPFSLQKIYLHLFSVFHQDEYCFITAFSYCVLIIYFIASIWGTELNRPCGKDQVSIN